MFDTNIWRKVRTTNEDCGAIFLFPLKIVVDILL